APDRIENSLVVILGILGGLGIPYHFFAEDSLPVLHSAGLTVTGGQVESDAASVEMAPQGDAAFYSGRHAFSAGDYHLEGMLVHRSHEVHIEPTCAVGRVNRFDVIADLGRAANMKLPSTALPEQEFDDAFD